MLSDLPDMAKLWEIKAVVGPRGSLSKKATQRIVGSKNPQWDIIIGCVLRCIWMNTTWRELSHSLWAFSDYNLTVTVHYSGGDAGDGRDHADVRTVVYGGNHACVGTAVYKETMRVWGLQSMGKITIVC